MENLKIKVNSEAESKEAKSLLESLGFDIDFREEGFKYSYLFAYVNGMHVTGDDREGHFKNKNNKEITLPQLRDLVVLKRNYVGDATHLDKIGEPWLVSGNNEFYSWANSGWMQESENVVLNYNPKPIKKPMKEYLRKNSNGTYSYIGTVRHEHVSDFMIEIPEGANYAYNNDQGLCFLSGSLGDNHPLLIWQRHIQPEELPFVDDEPLQSLNDQYAEIEKVRQSHRTASEIADSALKHIRERAETYDQPTGERSAAKTAKAFNAITGKDITESEVWLLLQLLKDVRQWSREDYHQDSAEDCIAYAALKAESLEGGE